MGRNTNRDKIKNSMNDKQLVRSFLRGEVEEYQKIIDKYKGKVMALALNILGNREDAEDACQEAFIKVYYNLDSFDIQKSFRNWLYTILYNQCLDQLRKRRRFYRFFNKIKEESLPSAEGRASNQRTQHQFSKSLLKELSPKERAILFLWAVEGYTSEEVGSVLRCSSSTARVHLFKARKKIKAILEKENVSMQDN